MPRCKVKVVYEIDGRGSYRYQVYYKYGLCLLWYAARAYANKWTAIEAAKDLYKDLLRGKSNTIEWESS